MIYALYMKATAKHIKKKFQIKKQKLFFIFNKTNKSKFKFAAGLCLKFTDCKAPTTILIQIRNKG